MQSTMAKGSGVASNSNQQHGFQHGAMAIPEGKRFTCTARILAALSTDRWHTIWIYISPLDLDV